MSGVGEEWALDGDGLAVILVGPSCIVTVTTNRKLQVGVERSAVRFTVVLKKKN